MIFTQSEGTAARRRFPLYLVDATDGITPETGEAAGQPQISKAGGAWANTTATLSAVGNGGYYVELTATELDTLGPIQVRYKSANTAEFNAPGVVVAYDQHNAVRLGLTALPNAAAEAAGGLYTRGTGAGQINQNANGQVDANATHFAGTAYATARAALVQAVWDALTTALTTVGSIGKKLADWVVGTIDTYTGNTKQTGDAFARLGAPAGASTAADIAAVKAQTAAIETDTAEIGAAGAGLTALATAAALAAVAADLPHRYTRAVAVTGFTFFMRDSTTHAAATGLTVTAQRSIDGGALGACANAVSEIGNGLYKITLATTDMDGVTIALRFTATGADDLVIILPTQPT